MGSRQVGIAAVSILVGSYGPVCSRTTRARTVPEEVRARNHVARGQQPATARTHKEAETIYRQIIAKYPGRDEAKDARYQQLDQHLQCNDPTACARRWTSSSTTIPRRTRDQAKLLKAEALYKQKISRPRARSMPNCAIPTFRQVACRIGLTNWLVLRPDEDPTRSIDAFTYFLQAFPGNPQVPSALAQRALAYQETNNTSRPERSRACS